MADASYSFTNGPAITDWTHTFAVPQSSTPLDSVTVLITEEVDATGTIKNKSAGPDLFTLFTSADVTLTLPDSTVLLATHTTPQTDSQTLGVNQIWTVSSSHTFTTSAVLTGAAMNAFLGGGTVGITASTKTGETVTGGGGNIAFDLDTVAKVTMVIDYASTTIPEPTTAALLLGGLGALAWSRRGGRKS